MGAVLVTGGAGFVGAHLSRTLLLRGRDVVVYDMAPSVPEFVAAGATDGTLTHLRSDVTDPAQLVEAMLGHGVTDVVHVAALLAEPESIQRPRLFLRVNAEAVWQLCDIARHIPALRRIVTVSTRSVYGKYTPEEGPIDETFAPRPVAFYGAGKAAADLVLALYREHFGLDVTAARITGAFGPHQNYPHALSQMIDAAVEGRPYMRDRGGDYLYEFTYVKDVVRGLLALLDADRLSHPVYNLGSGQQHRLSEVADGVRAAVPSAEIEVGPGLPEGSSPRASLSVERIAGDVGFRTIWSLERGIAEHVRWKTDGSYGEPVE
jgi:nucleoside-diphosphate-sugar epimerase